MVQLWRTVLAWMVVATISGCGIVKREEPTVPEPITAEQKAVASPENPDSVVLADFNARLDRFVKTQRALLKRAPISEDATPAQIKGQQETLAAQLRDIRKNAKRGDIFTPQVSALFKRLMSPEVKGAERKETREALEEEDGEVAEVWLKVNAPWPDSEPLTTTPANILANLPQLPKDVEYRIANKRHLVLRDVDANIIVDFIYNAIR